MRWLVGAALLIGTLACVGRLATAGERDPARAITSQLICPCSCGEVLSGCTCDTGKSMQGFVENSLKAGKGKDQIVGALVSQYGEVIRGAPKPKGFNLVVWIAPFVATAIGFLIAALVLRRWVRRHELVVAPVGGPPSPGQGAPRSVEGELAALRARAEAELRRLRE
jgi:cytochrome c-type biogenesis protein CcmH/NrfF